MDSALDAPTLPSALAPRTRGGAGQSTHRALGAISKVPEITAYFWIVKLLTTAMGESTSDYLVYHINPYLAVILGGIGLVVALAIQFAAPRYVAWIYWLAVLMVAIAGTMAADVLHIEFGVPYYASTAFFAVAVAVILAAWYRGERTLSIHSIHTPRRELFYWATVIATFALGTAAGDLAAFTLGLGFFSSGILFVAVFAVPALAYWRLGLNAIVAFWSSYIVTRPIGASYADWLGKARSVRGLGLGDGPVSLVLGILIVGFVAYLTVTREDTKGEQE
ncbi:MAG TPA: hypothetical protein VN837_14555 [Chloroflexota bacterium]|nr:hypothetical protein [Chloroflexota bacterium]